MNSKPAACRAFFMVSFTSRWRCTEIRDPINIVNNKWFFWEPYLYQGQIIEFVRDDEDAEMRFSLFGRVVHGRLIDDFHENRLQLRRESLPHGRLYRRILLAL